MKGALVLTHLPYIIVGFVGVAVIHWFRRRIIRMIDDRLGGLHG